MTEIDAQTGLPLGLPPGAPLTATHIIYALHAWSALIGITSAMFIVTAFLAGWPSIIGVIINYVKRSEAAGTYLEHYKYHVAPQDPIYDQAGTFGGPADALPRFRGFISSTWTNGPWAVTGRLNYTHGWFDGGNTSDPIGGGCFRSGTQLTDNGCYVKAWTTVDVGVQYTGIKNVSMGVLVRNIDDRAAPYDAANATTTAAGFNAQFHNALGRYYTVNASYSFK